MGTEKLRLPLYSKARLEQPGTVEVSLPMAGGGNEMGFGVPSNPTCFLMSL